MTKHFSLRALVLFATIATAEACTATPAAAPPLPAKPLPTYDSHAALLFDDGVDPLPAGGVRPVDVAIDPMLRERTLAGDGVFRARVVTVTGRNTGGADGWIIELHSIESLARTRMAPRDFTVQVPAGARGSATLGDPDARVVGSEVLAFLRVFARPDGSGEWHFHITQAADAQIRAVREAALVSEVR